MNKITKIEIFKRVMSKAKGGGYTGPDYEFQLGHIIEDTNIYAVIFREDFAKAIWGEHTITSGLNIPFKAWEWHLEKMSTQKNKWEYLEENAFN
jgi:hypothetical protein